MSRNKFVEKNHYAPESPEEKIRRLEALLEERRAAGASTRARDARKAPERTGWKQQRASTAILAPGISTTTIPGSLYDAMKRAMARLARLELHAKFFADFRKNRTPAGARKLLDALGVDRNDLDRLVYADKLFREHQKDQTRKYRNRAARGDKHAAAILRDPEISDGKGRWKGDLGEALNILYCARRPDLVNRIRNVGHMKKSGLLFDRSYHGAEAAFYMYPRQYYSIFRSARAMAGA